MAMFPDPHKQCQVFGMQMLMSAILYASFWVRQWELGKISRQRANVENIL